MSEPLERVMTIISLRPDGNHADLEDETNNGYIEGQAEDIIALVEQHFVEQACAAITDNPHKNPIEAITDMVRKETD